MNTSKICVSLLAFLQLSGNLGAVAQAPFFGGPPPVIPPTPPTPVIIQNPTVSTTPIAPTITNTPVVQVTPRVNIPSFTLPSGLILPTDTLSKQANLSGNRVTSKGGKVPERVFEITDLESFLGENDWHHGTAQEWLPQLDSADAFVEEAGTVEAESSILPISYHASPDQPGAGPSILQQEPKPILLKLTSAYRDLHVFTGANQALVEGETVMTAAAGTIVSSHKDFFTLHMGSLSIDTGNTAARIATRIGGIKIEPQSTCEIDYQPGKRLVIRSLQGPKISVRAKLLSLPDRIIEGVPGEQISINLDNQAAVNGERIVHEICQATPLQQDLGHRFSGEGAKLMHRMSEHLVSAKQIPAATPNHEAKTTTCAPLHLIASEDSYLTTTSKGQLGLLAGRFFISAETAQIIQLRTGDVYMQPHSVAAIEAGQGLMRVQCCTDAKSVIVVTRKYGVPMHWGMESLILDHQATWEEAIPKDGVGRRAFEIHKKDAKEIVLSDFQLSSLLSKSAHLAGVRTPVHARNALLKEKLLRIAASLQVVTAGHGGYQVSQQPKQQ